MKSSFVWGVVLLAAASSAQAQVKWDSPFLISPRPSPGVGLFLVDLDGPGAGVGALITWQPSPTSWGFRGGIVESAVEDLAVVFGADVSGAITRSTTDMPLDIDWVFGVGLGVDDDVVVSLPVGITMGHTFSGEGALFTPYLTPRVILDAWFGDRNETLDLEFAVDLGLDLRLRGNWTIRFGGTIGNREAIAIGLVL
ncbi:MAG: hypothetical protein ACRENP_26685 [Longimicrobiales bacterium]